MHIVVAIMATICMYILRAEICMQKIQNHFATLRYDLVLLLINYLSTLHDEIKMMGHSQ